MREYRGRAHRRPDRAGRPDRLDAVALGPVDEAQVERRYVPCTNVLETTYTTATGRARVTDSLNTGRTGRLPWCELGRRIDGLEGSVLMRADVVPGTCLNTASPWVYDSVHGKVLRVDGPMTVVRTLEQESVQVAERSIAVDYRTAPGSRQLLGLTSTAGEPLFLQTPEAIGEGIGGNRRCSAARCCSNS